MNISSASLQAILKNSPHGYAITDQEGRVLWINDTFSSTFGYSSDECLHQNLDDLIVPDNSQNDSQKFHANLKVDPSVIVEETFQVKNSNRPIHVSISVTPIHDENGTCCTCYHYTDITRRDKAKKHASALHEISHAINSTQNLEELYASIHVSLGRLIDTTNFFIALYDKEVDQITFVYYTDVAEEVGKNIELIENASKATSSYTARVVFSGKPLLLTAEQIKKDYEAEKTPIGPIAKNWLGVPLCIKKEVIGAVAVQSYTVPDNYDERDIGILHSVTEQIAIAIETKRTEQELKESESLHKTLFNQGVDAIMVHDFNGKILKVNDIALARFEYSEEEFATLQMKDLCMSPQDYPIEKVVQTANDIGTYIVETWQKTQFGHEIISELHSKPIYYQGQPAIICSARDITEKKAREAEQHALKQRLAQAQTMQALGQLAGGVAHDLNNILSGISSYPELMLLQLPEDSPLRGPLETIKKSGFRAAEIVDDMLTLTRLGKRSDTILNLNNSINDFLVSAEFLKIQNENPNIEVTTTFSNALWNIKGSEAHLSKVFMNLLKNGFEAIIGYGKIHVETENTCVLSHAGEYEHIPKGEYVTLRISDSGIGISTCNIQNIFEPFYTTKEMGNSGTGLGMAIVWRTVKDHNGYIDINSLKGAGTTFSIYFPASPEELPDLSQNNNLADLSGNGELIYVVDDVSEQRFIAGSILKEIGYRVQTFESGEKVLAFLEAKKTFPSLFILDMIMEPGMDGAETFKNICKMAPDQKALIASGFSEIKRVEAADQIGASQYLRKPYSLEKLARAVKECIERKRQYE